MFYCAVTILYVQPDSTPSLTEAQFLFLCAALIWDHLQRVMLMLHVCRPLTDWLLELIYSRNITAQDSKQTMSFIALLICSRLTATMFLPRQLWVTPDWNIVAFTSSFIWTLTQDAVLLCSVYSLLKGAFGW